MTVKKTFARPKATSGTPKAVNESTVEALINKGGSVADSTNNKSGEVKNVQLRLSVTDLSRIDAARISRLVKPSRHAWMLEAIYEKLEREEGAAKKPKPGGLHHQT